MPSKHPRIESVIAASHGEPRDLLDGVVDDSIRDALSEGQRSRLDTACSEVLRVYPDRPGRYIVQSPEGEQGDHTRYTVDMMYENAKTCTCGDYMYRCDPGSGQMCKHLWRTNLLIKVGALPDPGANSYDWLLDELVRDRNLLEAMEEGAAIEGPAPSEQMKDLIEEMSNTHRIAVDYPRICTARANILKSIYNVSQAV